MGRDVGVGGASGQWKHNKQQHLAIGDTHDQDRQTAKEGPQPPAAPDLGRSGRNPLTDVNIFFKIILKLFSKYFPHN